MRADTESPRLGGFNPCRGLPQFKSFGGLLIDRLPELVVHAGAPDVILDLNLARAVQPLRVVLSWRPVRIGLTVFHSEASIFAQAPPPVTYTSVLSPNHQKLFKP